MGRVKLALFVLLMANLPRVEDFVNQGTCDWICSADTDMDKESREMLSNGRLVKFRVLNEERVDNECANQTDVTNSSTRALLWLKMAASNKPTREKRQGRLQFFTHAILEGIFSGQFALGDYKEINVSCIFKSTSITKSVRTNYSSLRLSFHTSQSVLYLVANNTKPNATFLTLLRMENNTGLSVGVTRSSASLSSAKSANDNVLVFTDWWLLVAVIIWIVFLLYSPGIFILLRPSEIKLKVPRDARKARYPTDSDRSGVPIKETGDDIGYIEPETREGRVPPIEDDHEGSEIAEGACGYFLSSRTQYEGNATAGSFPVKETKSPSDQDSEITVRRLYQSKAFPHFCGQVNMPKKDQEWKLVNDKNRKKLDYDLPQDLDDTYDTYDTPDLDGECASKYGGFSTSFGKHRITSTCDGSLGNETLPTGSYQVSNGELLSSDGKFDTAVTDTDKELSTSNRNDEELCVSDRNGEELIASIRNDEELIAPNRNDEELIASIRNDEELIASNRNDEGRSASHRNGDIDSSHVVGILVQSSLTDEDAQQESGVQSPREEEDKEDTEYVRAIIVGETYPVGFGSCIGNKLFSTTKRNIFCNVVKLILIFCAPLFFVGLGDFFLALLPNLHSRLSDHLPFPFLTSSLVYGIIDNNPIVLVFLVFSALSYLIRLFCLCFLSSSTPVETAWESCSVHRMHPTCFSYKLLQRFFSVFPPPKSICNLNHVCTGQHLKCAVCHWFYKTCLSFKPCENCNKPAPSECSKYLSLPDNVSHNLEKHPDIFIKYKDSFSECLSNFGETKSIACSLKVFFFALAVVPLIIDIFFSTPLVCLCHGRLWMLNERYKNKFKGSRFILPILECLLILLSQVWATFFSLFSAIPLGVATVGLVKLLGSHSGEVLPLVTIPVYVMHFFWSCYRSFATPYRDLAKFLAERYKKKFAKQEKNPGGNVLIHYKQGDLEVIPRELFDDGCNEFNLFVKNKVALLFAKLGLTLLVCLFVFPILGSDDVSNTLDLMAAIGFFVAYMLINNIINGGKFEFSKVGADNVVDNYIARKQ